MKKLKPGAYQTPDGYVFILDKVNARNAVLSVPLTPQELKSHLITDKQPEFMKMPTSDFQNLVKNADPQPFDVETLFS